MVSLGTLKRCSSDILLSPGVRLASLVKKSLICRGMSALSPSSDNDEFKRDKMERSCTPDHGITSSLPRHLPTDDFASNPLVKCNIASRNFIGDELNVPTDFPKSL